MRKINICFHIGDISKCGGTEKVATQIASMLLEHYDIYNIFIVSSYYDTNVGPYFAGNEKIRYFRLHNEPVKSFKVSYFKTIKLLNKFIKENNINILVSVDTILALFDLPAKFNTPCKYIGWEHFNFNYNLGTKLRDFGRKIAAKHADAIVVLTKKDKEYFNSNLKPKCRLEQIYNPFISESKKYQYNSSKNTILSIGRLTYQKGFDLLIEVASKLKQKTSDFKWIILGEGEDRLKLENMISSYGLENHVELKGNVKDVETYYNSSIMFVSTSRFEGQPLVILEAKTYNLPCVSFNCDCGPSEMIKNDMNGILIDDFNTELMADKISELLKDYKKCVKFSKNSKVDMEEFTPDSIIKKWDKLFKEVLEGK